jgi:hypothetical protein
MTDDKFDELITKIGRSNIRPLIDDSCSIYLSLIKDRYKIEKTELKKLAELYFLISLIPFTIDEDFFSLVEEEKYKYFIDQGII